jgi:tRNA pseudouridine65 synthase
LLASYALASLLLGQICVYFIVNHISVSIGRVYRFSSDFIDVYTYSTFFCHLAVSVLNLIMCFTLIAIKTWKASTVYSRNLSLKSKFAGLSWAKGVELISFQQAGLIEGNELDAVNKVVIENNLLFAANKPPKILSHPNNLGVRQWSLLKYDYDQSKECYIIPRTVQTSDRADKLIDQNPVDKLFLLHRLDQATSGIILLTTDEKIATLVKRNFKKRLIEKEYIAKVFGKYTHPKLVEWEDEVKLSSSRVINAKRLESSSSSDPAKKTARTFVKQIMIDESSNDEGGPTCSYLLLKPATGFTHQLRFQCAKHGYPIVGDHIYGNVQDLNRVYFARKRLKPAQQCMHLHARQIQLQLDGASKPIFAEAAFPDYFFL